MTADGREARLHARTGYASRQRPDDRTRPAGDLDGRNSGALGAFDAAASAARSHGADRRPGTGAT